MATVYAEEIIVTPEISQIELGQSIQLTATVLPENAVNKQIEWASDDNTFAHANRISVDQNGVITGNSVGSGYVTVYTKMVSTRVSKRLDIEVVNPENAVLTNRIVISPSSLTLRLGETAKLSVSVGPNNATCKNVFWNVPQGAVTNVDQQGNVVASKVGGSRIIAKSADGNSEAWIPVTVIDSETPIDPDDPTPTNPDDHTPVTPDDPTPATPDDSTQVDPVQYGDDVITYIKRVGDEYVIEKQYVGNLNFKTGGFFDSIVDYETDNLSKVYWVDGVNQPRVITLEEDWSQYDDTSFDFVPEIDKFPHVYIEKEHTSGAGIFKAGIVQYFFTYSNIHGVETAVVYSSPLFYADHRKRAGAPDDFVECQFNISISNLSQKFDKINIYRAIRTSVNTEVEMVKIANIDITGDTTSIIDDYVGGQAVSPTDLFFKGGDRFVAGTLAAKDNTLFLGNIDLDVPDYSELKSVLDDIYPAGFGDASTMKQLSYVDSSAFLNGNREITYTQGYSSGNYFHSSNSYLKNGDYYNIGIQLQDKYGKWSEPILFDDFLSPSGRPSNGRIPKQLLEVNVGHISNSIKNKYKRIRAVACFPNENKRNFIAQGVLNPSVYCSKDRNENRPYAMSSWFFRSIPEYLNNNPAHVEDTTLEYRHDRILGYNNSLNSEIQFMDPFIIEGNNDHSSFALVGLRLTDYSDSALQRVLISNLFAIDSSICTLNSPDITDIGADQESCNVDIVGYFNTERVVSEYNISMATASRVTIGGFSNITDERIFKGERQNPLSTWPLYFDSFTYYPPMSPESKQYTQDTGVAWAVYPWQADRPLGNDYDENNTATFVRGGTNTSLRGQYSKKVLGNIRYCGDTSYMAVSNNIDNISDVNYYRNIASGLTRILSEDNTEYGAYNYYSVVDEIFTGYSSRESGLLKNNLYILRYSNGSNALSPEGTRDDAVPYTDFISSDRRILFNNYSGAYTETYDTYTLIAQEPVLIRYKSTPHAVFKINPRYDTETGQYVERVLPGYLALERWGDQEWPSIWNGCTGLESAIPGLFDHQELENTDRYWMGELTRDTNPEQMFPLDINDREFVPVSDIYDFSGDAFAIELYGDIHYQRWDCLKTYPYSYDDKNQIIDVLSFMVESKINLDGRYDKYVETEDVTIIDDSFFNKIDDVYNQKDNFFTYRIQEDWLKENNSFPNQFAWSQTKHPGEEIDTWTSINLASTYQADGSLGEIRKIIKFGDSLFCFQDKGISQIMFNSNIQLSASSGVPIELANSGKVDGVRYITNMEGCVNPWTIKAGLVGIYFVDDINHSLDKLAADGIHRLSENKGFSDFVHRGHPFRTTWYDKEKKDVHFVTGNQTLCYSEKMDEFTSFYDYGRANIAFNVGDNWNQMYGYDNDLFTARRGDYFYFFDDEEPSTFSVTYRVAPQPFNYKIFNTVDYLLRVNSVDGINHDLTYNSGFHEISVSTENGDVTHRIDKSDFTQNMNQIKKFNIWRTNIPRFDYFRRADGTSMYLCLRAGRGKNGIVYDNNLSDKRYELHNLKISYLS